MENNIKSSLTIKINNIAKMQSLASLLTHMAHPSTVIALNGDLGAGKTTFTKGIGMALGIKKIINSPTFTIMKIYEAQNKINHINKLYHLDVYRLKDEKEDFELEEYFYEDGITVIEWANIILPLLPTDTWYLDIYMFDNDINMRKVVLKNIPLEILTKIGEKYEVIN